MLNRSVISRNIVGVESSNASHQFVLIKLDVTKAFAGAGAGAFDRLECSFLLALIKLLRRWG